MACGGRVPVVLRSMEVEVGAEHKLQVVGRNLPVTILDTKPEVQLTGEVLLAEDTVLLLIQVYNL